MRIIGGEYRSRLIKTLPGRSLRPTSDRLRETLFNILGAAVPGAVFIDCYAGSGAVGLEALSRGAARSYFIESDESAVRLIRANAASLNAEDRATLLPMQAARALAKLAAQGIRADLCFLDPPYAALPEGLRNLLWLTRSLLMQADGLVILEHSRRDATPEQASSWRRTRLLEQGSAALSFYRRALESNSK